MRRNRYLTTGTPELIRDRIVRLKSELRELRIALRLAEAEQRDRRRMQQQAERQEARRG